MVEKQRILPGDQDESYFVSMTDLMVGMLFIFIIMLMAFALNYREAQQTQADINEELTGARKARDRMLEDIRKVLHEQGVRVEIDRENGVLRLGADLLFERGRSTLSEPGRKLIGHVSQALTRLGRWSSPRSTVSLQSSPSKPSRPLTSGRGSSADCWGPCRCRPHRWA